MKVHDLKPAKGSVKARKRIGRGMGSGTGKTSGRGHKGQGSRSGGKVPRGFEGGQMPLQRRVPKRGFTNIFKKQYSIINLSDLNIFNEGDLVDIPALIKRGIVKNVKDGVKLLGKGTVEKKLSVKVTKASSTAIEKIRLAKGTVEVD